MTAAVPGIVVDVGNSRIKWGRLDDSARLAERSSSDLFGDPAAWDEVCNSWVGATRGVWAISSVNPPVAGRLERWLAERGVVDARWFRSAADVPLPMRVREPARAGADRALSVLAARGLAHSRGPGLVVSCGTALTIERIDDAGRWEGGAIGAGLDAVARAMRSSTAQLPRIDLDETGPAPTWGDDTESAMKAGTFWGTVGALRELIARQGEDRWRIWTGGRAPLLAGFVEEKGAEAWIVPDLVLRGLAMVAFGATAEELDDV